MMDDIRALHQQTRTAWNEGAAFYAASVEKDVAFLRAGGTNFEPPERPFLEGLRAWCGRAIHLQCAGGTDTLSLWNLGAREVVGVDISEAMLECAQRKSDMLQAPAQWVHCDVLETPHELDGTADLVYTGRGALCWILDIDAWARIPARLLRPSGRLYVFDSHPLTWIWDQEKDFLALDPKYGDYFMTDITSAQGWGPTYIGDLGRPAHELSAKYERQWTLSQIVNAVLAAGLRVERLEEHPDTYWDQFPLLPPDTVRRLPNTFSLLARKD